jgi:hypothetical protein
MPGKTPTRSQSNWFLLPYGIGIGLLLYLILGTNLGGRIYGGISIALMLWFFVFGVYTLFHLLWLRVRRRKAAEVQQ